MVLATVILAGLIGNPFADLTATGPLKDWKEGGMIAPGAHTRLPGSERYFGGAYNGGSTELTLWVYRLAKPEDVPLAMKDKSYVRAAAQRKIEMPEVEKLGAKLYYVGNPTYLEVDVVEGRVWTRFLIARPVRFSRAGLVKENKMTPEEVVRADKPTMKLILSLIPEVRKRAKQAN